MENVSELNIIYLSISFMYENLSTRRVHVLYGLLHPEYASSV